MVSNFDIHHLFKFPVDVVVKAYIKLINCDKNGNISELQTTKDDASGMDCMSWVFVWENSFPSFFQRLEVLQKSSVTFYGELWSLWKEKKHWIRSRNITWQGDSEIGRLVYICQHENNKNWTYWEESNFINLEGFGAIGYALEMYLKRKLKTKSYQEIKALEEAIKADLS